MCEAGEKEIRQCEKLAKVLAAAGNGRCEYHEELIVGMSGLRGLVKGLLFFLVPAFMAFITLQSATLWKLYDHSKDRQAHHTLYKDGPHDNNVGSSEETKRDSGKDR